MGLTIRSLVASLALLAFGVAHADVERHWIARIGAHPIEPQPHAHPTIDVSNGVAVSLGAAYLFTPHWALELFATLPSEHTLSVDGNNVGRFDLQPATASIQYYWTDARDRVRVFAGVGIAYARLADERASGAWTARSLSLGDTTGPSAHAGLDMNLGSRWFATVDARWFDIDSQADVGGGSIGTLHLDPLSLGLSIGRRLR